METENILDLDLQYIKSDILIKLKILKTVCETHVEYSEDMDLEELKEIYKNSLFLYLREKEIQDQKDLIGKIKWLGYDDVETLHILDIKHLTILYQNLLKENKLTEKDMDDYVSIVGILVMFANR
jgi:hypothetical protein